MLFFFRRFDFERDEKKKTKKSLHTLEEMERKREIAREACVDVDNLFLFLQLVSRWTPQNVCAHPYMQGGAIGKSTLDEHTLSFAAQCIDESLPKDLTLNILEIGCGSGHASSLLCLELQNRKRLNTWIATDILSLWETFVDKTLPKTNIRFIKEHAVQAVTNFGRKSNMLLLVAPLPHEALVFRKGFGTSMLTIDNDEAYCGYADYYAVRMFIEQHKNDIPRFIAFIGELGVAHGSVGLYTYLLNNRSLKLLTRRSVLQTLTCHQEVFVFQII